MLEGVQYLHLVPACAVWRSTRVLSVGLIQVLHAGRRGQLAGCLYLCSLDALSAHDACQDLCTKRQPKILLPLLWD